MKIVIMLLSLLTTGLLVGNELAVALFIHPVLYSVHDEAHVRVAKPLARRLGRFMPFWYAISLMLAILQLLVVGRGSLLSWWLCCAAGWDLDRLPEDWLSMRRRWDLYHRVRVLLLVFALILLILAALLNRDMQAS